MSRFSRLLTLLVAAGMSAINTVGGTSFADEALLREASGSLAMMSGDDTTVRMAAEEVTITLEDSFYTVDAVFEFRNEGDKTVELVGFPDYGYGYSEVFHGVIENGSFETWVNGEPAAFTEKAGTFTYTTFDVQGRHEQTIEDETVIGNIRRALRDGEKFPLPVREDGLLLEETRWFVKEVAFAGHATTTTRVRYRAGYGSFGHVEYLYGTGRSWMGTIGTARFIVKASPRVWAARIAHFANGGIFSNYRPFVINRLSEYSHDYVIEDFEPLEKETFRLFRNTREQNQVWELYGQFDLRGMPITIETLHIMSAWQLKLFKNVFYAIHGKKFNESDLDAFFRRYEWYKPDDDFKESDLDDSERAYVAMIAAYERDMKPLLDGK